MEFTPALHNSCVRISLCCASTLLRKNILRASRSKCEKDILFFFFLQRVQVYIEYSPAHTREENTALQNTEQSRNKFIFPAAVK